MIRERRGWTRKEEEKLREYVATHGPHHWDTISRALDIGRSGNSCRLKWVNYLKPDTRKGKFTDEEILIILKLRYHGNGWSKIAKELPGRTDNHIKNFCNSKRLKKQAERMNICDVKSEEFLNKMTSKLMEQTSSLHHAYSLGGSGVTTADTLRDDAGSTFNGGDQEFADELSIWDYLVTSCDILDN